MGDPIPSGAGAMAPAPCTGPVQIWAVDGRAQGPPSPGWPTVRPHPSRSIPRLTFLVTF